MAAITAIETRWNGYRFRSRLEARWAVYFNSLGLKWEYELEGFNLPSGSYLPDFWLEDVRLWAEMKPKAFSEKEFRLVEELCFGSQRGCLLLVGPPDFCSYPQVWPAKHRTKEMSMIVDTMISNFHSYPKTENRFFSCCGWDVPDERMPSPIPADSSRFWRGQIGDAVEAARSARFEHGESPLVKI